jgi:hypothetical protein
MRAPAGTPRTHGSATSAALADLRRAPSDDQQADEAEDVQDPRNGRCDDRHLTLRAVDAVARSVLDLPCLTARQPICAVPGPLPAAHAEPGCDGRLRARRPARRCPRVLSAIPRLAGLRARTPLPKRPALRARPTGARRPHRQIPPAQRREDPRRPDCIGSKREHRPADLKVRKPAGTPPRASAPSSTDRLAPTLRAGTRTQAGGLVLLGQAQLVLPRTQNVVAGKPLGIRSVTRHGGRAILDWRAERRDRASAQLLACARDEFDRQALVVNQRPLLPMQPHRKVNDVVSSDRPNDRSQLLRGSLGRTTQLVHL